MARRVYATANLMQSSQAFSMSNLPSRKSTSELVSALRHSVADPGEGAGALQDERSEYEVTVKLFFPPNAPSSDPEGRARAMRDALSRVCASLSVETVDLLILSFPGIVLDAEDAGDFSDAELSPILDVYRSASELVRSGALAALGVAEFSASRLLQLSEAVDVPPQVDQINLKDCCVTPKDLILLAKQRGVKLFTHSDASDILPTETLREVLGVDARPVWVCKFTAVASSRGVVEKKGYLVAVQDD